MVAHLHEWIDLLLRWMHFIFGVAWIGASFYFNWLENHLERDSPRGEGIAGDLWAIHGGGFYHLKKFTTGPDKLPVTLHWFKWEAYATWLSGFCLLVVAYYLNAQLFLLAPNQDGLSAESAIALGVAAVLGSWFVYDALCRSKLRRAPTLLAVCIFVCLAILAWALSGVFSGRAAYIHIGAAIGTMMVGNVFFAIIPAQKEMVAALTQKRALDPKHGERGLLRSRHNNYLTLPVLFIMISGHFPGVYGHHWNWVALALISIAGWLARHYFNVRHKSRAALGWLPMALLPLAFLVLAGVAWMTVPSGLYYSDTNANHTNAVGIEQVAPIITARCTTCHAAQPTQPGFAAPPAGLVLETRAEIERNAARIFSAAVATRSMPIGNLTGMTDAERELIAAWHNARAHAATNVDEK